MHIASQQHYICQPIMYCDNFGKSRCQYLLGFKLLLDYFLLIFGLVLSIVLMAVAATLISKWIKKHKWIAWIGLLAILLVAIELIYTDIKILI